MLLQGEKQQRSGALQGQSLLQSSNASPSWGRSSLRSDRLSHPAAVQVRCALPSLTAILQPKLHHVLGGETPTSKSCNASLHAVSLIDCSG